MCATVAGIAAETRERDGTTGSEFDGRFPHQQTHFVMTRVVAESYRRAIFGSNTALGTEDQVLVAPEVVRIPAHASILGPAENVPAGQGPQHRRRQGQLARRADRVCLNFEDRRIVRSEQPVHGFTVWLIQT